jgi:hypothetical protein
VTYFRVLVQGEGIDVPVADGRGKGFLVNRFVRAESQTEAGVVALAHVEREWREGRQSIFNVVPHLSVSEIERVGLLSGLFARQQGYIFHPGS